MSAPKPLNGHSRLPEWLRVRLPEGRTFCDTRALVADLGLHTVCTSARCPNIFECFSRGAATFLVLGNRCSRACSFCNIDHCPGESLDPPDPSEPARAAEAARRLGLAYAVVTSVTRDDLPDGGAGHFAAVVAALRAAVPGIAVELLIPDFQGSEAALTTVLDANPTVLNHNVETAPRLYPRVRPQADYAQSLALLARVRDRGFSPKSGLMVGLGEDDDEVRAVLRDLARAGCGIATVGQYLPPSRRHPPVQRFVTPEVFESYAAYGREVGIPRMHSAPLVRSSYHAERYGASGEPNKTVNARGGHGAQ